MVTELSRRTSYSGPALVRLLSRLAQVEVAEPRQSPAARLDQWLGWTESIALSSVLKAAASTSGESSAAAAAPDGNPDTAVHNADVVDDVALAQAEYVKVREALEQSIAAAVAPPAPVSALQRRQIRSRPTAGRQVDFPSYRRSYVLLQQKMDSSIAGLRARLRALLAARSEGMAQLAAIDGAMEQALAEQQLRVLAAVPGLLERRFQHLVQMAGAEKPVAETNAVLESDAGQEAFRDDMRSVLLAELDFRLQPVMGLLRTFQVR